MTIESIESSIPTSAMRVGRYEVLRRIAVSDVAEIVLARLVGLANFRKLVVLKWIRSDLEELERAQASFAREARIAARLDHPNIVHTLDFGLAQGRQFVAMEYVHGESLASTMARTGTLPLECAVRIVSELLGALEYAHTRADDDGSSLGIVHRDVAPANVLLTYEGHVVLVDFGIARAAAWEDLTYTGEVRGKLDYAAPEQARGEAIDHRADIYSAGVLLGRLVGERHRDAVAAILERATAPDRRHRHASAAAMRDALLEVARTRGLDMSSAPLERLVRATFAERPHPSAAPQSWFAGVRAASAREVVEPAPGPSRVRAASRGRIAIAVAAVLAMGIGLWLVRDPDEAVQDTASAPVVDAAPSRPATPESKPESAPRDALPTSASPSESPIVAPVAPARAAEPKRARPRPRRVSPRPPARDPDAPLPTRENR